MEEALGSVGLSVCFSFFFAGRWLRCAGKECSWSWVCNCIKYRKGDGPAMDGEEGTRHEGEVGWSSKGMWPFSRRRPANKFTTMCRRRNHNAVGRRLGLLSDWEQLGKWVQLPKRLQEWGNDICKGGILATTANRGVWQALSWETKGLVKIWLSSDGNSMLATRIQFGGERFIHYTRAQCCCYTWHTNQVEIWWWQWRLRSPGGCGFVRILEQESRGLWATRAQQGSNLVDFDQRGWIFPLEKAWSSWEPNSW